MLVWSEVVADVPPPEKDEAAVNLFICEGSCAAQAFRSSASARSLRYAGASGHGPQCVSPGSRWFRQQCRYSVRVSQRSASILRTSRRGGDVVRVIGSYEDDGFRASRVDVLQEYQGDDSN